MDRTRFEKEIAFILEKTGIAELCRNNKKAFVLENFKFALADWLFATGEYLVINRPVRIEKNGKGYKMIDNEGVIYYFDDTELTQKNGIYRYSGRETDTFIIFGLIVSWAVKPFMC